MAGLAGKFFSDLPDDLEVAKEAVKKKAAPKRKKAVAVLTGERGCNACPLKAAWPVISTPKMETSANYADADVLVIGPLVTMPDDEQGIPFQSEQGKAIRKLIGGRNIDRVAFQNLTRCLGTQKAYADAQANYACSKWLERDLLESNVKYILGIGPEVLKQFWPSASLYDIHGLPFVVKIEDRFFWYYPVFDPYRIMQSNAKKRVEWNQQWIVMRADILNFFKSIDDWPEPTMEPFSEDDISYPETYADAKRAINAMSDPIGVDIETNCLHPTLKIAKILTAAFSDGKKTIAFPINHSLGSTDWGQQLFLRTLKKRRWVAHNAAFEYKWAAFFSGEELINYVFEDSMALGRIIHKRKTGISLDAMTRIHIGEAVKTLSDLDVKRLDEFPIKDVMRYNALDALACRLLYDKLHKKVPERAYTRILMSARSVTHMELLGLDIDTTRSRELEAIWQEKVVAAETKALKLYEVKQWQQKNNAAFNIGSNKQIAEALVEFGHIILPKTPAGNYKTDEATLAAAAKGHPLIECIDASREATKQIATYIKPVLAAEIEQYDGRLHPAYSTMLTHTLRLGSEDPNIQNYPKRRHREIRSQVKAPKKHVLVSIDYGQLEVRTQAMSSKDKQLIQDILDGMDMHSHWLDICLEEYPKYLEKLAHETNETEEAKIRKGGRDTIKNHLVFALLFGSTAPGCSARTGIPLPIMERIVHRFWKRYPGAAAWIKRQHKYYEETGDITSISGLFRHGVVSGNEPINSPIQSTGAALVQEAQNDLSYQAILQKDPYLHPRINIHDDLTFILPDNDARLEKYIDYITKKMVEVRFDFQIVPLMVEVKIGKTWDELTEVYKYTGDYVK